MPEPGKSLSSDLMNLTDEQQRTSFLAQARWLVAHGQRITNDVICWPVSLPVTCGSPTKQCLSALVQGQAISVLVRAFALIGESDFLDCARRALRTFERDVLDGGVSTPMPGNGLYFEEFGVYPASHTLEGMIFAMLALDDYLKLQDDASLLSLFARAHDSLHSFLPEFDTGYWTRVNLLNRHLANSYQHKQQVYLLELLAQALHCEMCGTVAARWRRYSQRVAARTRRHIMHGVSSFAGICLRPLQQLLFSHHSALQLRDASMLAKQEPLRVCVPITAFPVAGGMRTVVSSIADVTREIWHMEYLAHHVGPNPEQLPIHGFSVPVKASRLVAPWQFPAVWLYALAGTCSLVRLLRRNGQYAFILPQDGVYTAAYTACVARLAGIRVVCMDYGNLTLLHNPTYKNERREAFAGRNWFYRAIGPALLKCYWLSLAFFTRVSTHLVDHFLISGMEGDGIEDLYCDRLGVPRSRVTRYAYMVDLKRHPMLDAREKARRRLECSIPTDAQMITMICRFAPEKGVDIALESISQMLAALEPERRGHLVFVLAGNGPLQEHIEKQIDALGLRDVCKLWGEATPEDVVTLLSICDIFLHTSTRGAYYSMTLLEAMASGCAIVASNEPPLNTQLLADGRGVVVPAGDAGQTARALISLLGDADRGRQMGASARNYVACYHSPNALRQVLQRATHWSELGVILRSENTLENMLEETDIETGFEVVSKRGLKNDSNGNDI
ncbi:MAG TPA: glycosyltransferase [Ktedonobacteraceae bacterium]|nr:glycosyltransferase [Ktedonobacteraceae bacterium]